MRTPGRFTRRGTRTTFNHERSQRELRRLISQNVKVVVPYPTLLECYSLVMRGLGIRTAHGFLEELVRGSIFENASSEDYQKTSLRLLRYKDQDITLVDAVIADRLDAPVWTFDHHFDVMGANVWRWSRAGLPQASGPAR